MDRGAAGHNRMNNQTGQLTSSPDLPAGPGGPRGPTGPFRREKKKSNSLNSSTLHATATSCSSQEEVLHSVQALRAHRRVRCVPGVPGGRAETLFRVLTGWINAQKSSLCTTNDVNLQEVRGVQKDLWNPSCPAEKQKVVQQEKVRHCRRRLKKEQQNILTMGPGPGSGAFTPSY